MFVAGLEITPREFLRGGAASFTVGTIGVIVPFFVGFAVLTLFGLEALESMLVATALTATSIAISVQVLTELGKMQTKEARLILGAAIVDDILAIAVLSVVTTMVQTGDTSPQVMDVIFLILQILGLFAALLIGSIFLIPRLLHVEKLMEIQRQYRRNCNCVFLWSCRYSDFRGSLANCGSICCRYGSSQYTSYQTS